MKRNNNMLSMNIHKDNNTISYKHFRTIFTLYIKNSTKLIAAIWSKIVINHDITMTKYIINV